MHHFQVKVQHTSAVTRDHKVDEHLIIPSSLISGDYLWLKGGLCLKRDWKVCRCVNSSSLRWAENLTEDSGVSRMAIGSRSIVQQEGPHSEARSTKTKYLRLGWATQHKCMTVQGSTVTLSERTTIKVSLYNQVEHSWLKCEYFALKMYMYLDFFKTKFSRIYEFVLTFMI